MKKKLRFNLFKRSFVNHHMKKVFVLLIISILLVGCSNSKQSADFQKQGGFIKVSEKNPRYLSYSDGSPYIPIGLNMCFPRFEKDEDKALALMEERFKKLFENGGNYTRIWLSAPFYKIEDTKACEYNPVKVERIIKIITIADKYNIKLKFCFEHFRDLLNRPAPIECSVPFDKPIYHVSNGGPLNTMTEFFTTDAGKQLYLNRLLFFAEHFSDNPNVFGWELWNEIFSVGQSDSLFFAWTQEMLDNAREIFPNHLLMQSYGSFDQEYKIDYYKKAGQLNNQDILQSHRYLDPGAGLDVCKGAMDILASDAVTTLLDYTQEKPQPILLSEVGAVEAYHAAPSKLYAMDTLGILLHDMLFAPFFSGSAGPGQSWHWYFFIEKNDLWYHFNRFATAIEGINPIEEAFEPVFIETSDLRIYLLKGNKTTIAWYRDKNSNWQTELVDKIKPKIMNLTISLDQLEIAEKPIKAVSFYYPWKNERVKGRILENTISIPSFSRSIIVQVFYD